MEPCKLCNIEFKSKKSLQMHLSIAHKLILPKLKEYYDLYYKSSDESIDPFTGGETKFIGFTKGYSRFDGSEAKLLKEDPNRKYLGGYGVRKFMLMGYSEHDAEIMHSNSKEKRANNWHKMYKDNPDLFKGKRMGQIEYWVNEGYSEEEAKLKVKESQATFTLEKCIIKYGKAEGTKIFNKRQTKWKKSLHENFEREGDGRSPSSKFANSIIKELCSYLNIEIPIKEKWIMNKETQKAYSFDFTHKKKIIEFNGDYWHSNPALYEAEFFNKNKEMTACEVWEYDKEKIKTANNYNYEVLTIWEKDWVDNPKQTIKKCIKYLNKQ